MPGLAAFCPCGVLRIICVPCRVIRDLAGVEGDPEEDALEDLDLIASAVAVAAETGDVVVLDGRKADVLHCPDCGEPVNVRDVAKPFVPEVQRATAGWRSEPRGTAHG